MERLRHGNSLVKSWNLGLDERRASLRLFIVPTARAPGSQLGRRLYGIVLS